MGFLARRAQPMPSGRREAGRLNFTAQVRPNLGVTTVTARASRHSSPAPW